MNIYRTTGTGATREFMKKDFKTEGVYIPQRRWATVLGALFFLCLGGVLIAAPVLTYLLPLPAGIAAEELLAYRIGAFLLAIILGIPFIIFCICMLIKLHYMFALYADENGLFVNSQMFLPIFMPWECVVEIKYYHKHFAGRYSKVLEVCLSGGAAEHMNIAWRFFARRRRLRGYPYTLALEFSLCKGRAADNAADIIEVWQKWCNVPEIEN